MKSSVEFHLWNLKKDEDIINSFCAENVPRTE